MSNHEQSVYKFPDEDDDEIEIEIEDDTPEEDRGRQPMPKHIVDELEEDELDSYDERAQQRLKQMRKVYHDERREKEAAQREHQEAVSVAQRLLTENKRVNQVINNGEKEYVNNIQRIAQQDINIAKRAYKEAFEVGDADGIVEAQEQMQLANLRLVQAHNMQLGALQTPEYEVQQAQERLQRPVQQVARPDEKALDWQDRNEWFGKDKEMTSAALGLHAKLVDEGTPVGSKEYYNALDKTMRRRFSEYFGDSDDRKSSKGRLSNVVAPASRSTTSKKIKLTQSQVNLAKKFGLTPEQYAKAALDLENQNGR
jgi:ribosomal protein L24